MKKFLFTLVFVVCALVNYAQNESHKGEPLSIEMTTFRVNYGQDQEEKVEPSYINITRNCDYIDFDGRFLENMIVEMKSTPATQYYNPCVKVKIKRQDNKTIYKKTFKGYLYLFSNGQIQIGQPRFNQIIIYNQPITTQEESADGKNKKVTILVAREKEGVPHDYNYFE